MRAIMNMLQSSVAIFFANRNNDGSRQRLSRTDTGMKRGKATSNHLAMEGGLGDGVE